jgi:hypothetical protein
LSGLVVALLCGVGVALLLLPWIFQHTQSDVSRIGVLMTEMQNPTATPKVVALGNSIVMSGIDARQLRAELPGKPLSWNLASTGQTLAESFLFTQLIPASVEVAIYGMELQPEPREPSLIRPKYNAFYMFGFRPSEFTRRTLERIYPEVTPTLELSHLHHLFDARVAVRQQIDTRIRILLRTDIELEGTESDLFHPQQYSRPIDARVLDRLLEERGTAAGHIGSLQVREGTPALARAIVDEARKSGRATLFVLLPVHPGLPSPPQGSGRTGELLAMLAKFPQAAVLDVSHLLPAEDFIDHIHPTNEGARKLTTRIAEFLPEFL